MDKSSVELLVADVNEFVKIPFVVDLINLLNEFNVLDNLSERDFKKEIEQTKKGLRKVTINEEGFYDLVLSVTSNSGLFVHLSLYGNYGTPDTNMIYFGAEYKDYFNKPKQCPLCVYTVLEGDKVDIPQEDYDKVMNGVREAISIVEIDAEDAIVEITDKYRNNGYSY